MMTIKSLWAGLAGSFAALIIAASASAGTLVIGTVHENPRQQLTNLAPLASYLQMRLADHGVTDVTVSVLPDANSMAQAIRDEQVDLFFDSPLVAALVIRQAPARPLLRRWKNGVEQYRSLIVVPNTSSMRTLDDLQGMSITFEETESTSGFLLPASMLLQMGLELRPLAGQHDTPRDGEVGYLETRDDRNSMLWLVNGTVDAVAIDPHNWGLLNQVRPGEFRVLARSMFVPREIVVQRDGLAPELSNAIQGALRRMNQTTDGAHAMAMFDNTTRFDDFPLGIRATFTPIYDVLDQLSQAGLIR